VFEFIHKKINGISYKLCVVKCQNDLTVLQGRKRRELIKRPEMRKIARKEKSQRDTMEEEGETAT
jgi:hypothetical protein